MSINSILVVEDSELDRDLCSIIVAQYDAGIDLRFAEDGHIALEKLSAGNTRPDVILLDINMPNLGGFGFMDEFKQRYKPPAAPVIYVMIASAEQHGDIRKALSYDCVLGCIPKPLSLEMLSKISTRSRLSSFDGN